MRLIEHGLLFIVHIIVHVSGAGTIAFLSSEFVRLYCSFFIFKGMHRILPTSLPHVRFSGSFFMVFQGPALTACMHNEKQFLALHTNREPPATMSRHRILFF